MAFIQEQEKGRKRKRGDTDGIRYKMEDDREEGGNDGDTDDQGDDGEHESEEEKQDLENELYKDDSGKDGNTNRDSEHESEDDDHGNIAFRTFINGDEIYMKYESIQFVN